MTTTKIITLSYIILLRQNHNKKKKREKERKSPFCVFPLTVYNYFSLILPLFSGSIISYFKKKNALFHMHQYLRDIQKWSIKYYNHCVTHSTFFASFSYYKI